MSLERIKSNKKYVLLLVYKMQTVPKTHYCNACVRSGHLRKGWDESLISPAPLRLIIRWDVHYCMSIWRQLGVCVLWGRDRKRVHVFLYTVAPALAHPPYKTMFVVYLSISFLHQFYAVQTNRVLFPFASFLSWAPEARSWSPNSKSVRLLTQTRRQVWLEQMLLPQPGTNTVCHLPLIPGQVFRVQTQKALNDSLLLSESLS